MKVFCFEIVYIGFNGEWKKFAKQGRKLDAIKAYRLLGKNGLIGLKEAKDHVDKWMERHVKI